MTATNPPRFQVMYSFLEICKDNKFWVNMVIVCADILKMVYVYVAMSHIDLFKRTIFFFFTPRAYICALNRITAQPF